MTINLVKLCVGAETIDDLERWVKRRVSTNRAAGLGHVHDHITRMTPKRREEILDGGSIYWVIKGNILVRQEIVDLKPVVGADGIGRCAFLMKPPLISTQPFPRKAFQGWRYLPSDDAPPDLAKGQNKKGPAPELQIELAALGLL